MAKVKRSEFKTLINTTPSTTATYSLLNSGVRNAAINYNPSVEEETNIAEDNASIYVEKYAPTMPVEATAVKGDAVFDFVDTLRKNRATLDDAETDILNVWLYETPSGDSYPAEKQNVSISVEEFGGEGGQKAQINYTINYIGDPIPGTYDTVLGTFTAS